MSDAGWSTWLVIALGSGLGGVLRQVMTEAVVRWAGVEFPLGTLTVNVVGSLAIGMCVALSTAAGPATWTPIARHATMTGLLGGFTTFSTFSAQTLTLVQQGQWGAAAANALLSVALGVAACSAGYSLVASAWR